MLHMVSKTMRWLDKTTNAVHGILRTHLIPKHWWEKSLVTLTENDPLCSPIQLNQNFILGVGPQYERRNLGDTSEVSTADGRDGS